VVQLNPRWLVVVISPIGSTLSIFLQLKVPTIVMSSPKLTQQCLYLLWGRSCPTPSIVQLFQSTAEQKLKAAGVESDLDVEEYAALIRLASPSDKENTTSVEDGRLSKKRRVLDTAADKHGIIVAVNHFLDGIVALMPFIREYWGLENPRILSSLSITREIAESLLHGLRPGAFLLRFGKEAGTLIMSVRCGATATAIEHIRWRKSHFHSARLEQLLDLDGRGTHLLDPDQMLLYPREMVLRPGYVQALLVQQMRTHMAGRPPNALSLSAYGIIPAINAARHQASSAAVHPLHPDRPLLARHTMLPLRHHQCAMMLPQQHIMPQFPRMTSPILSATLSSQPGAADAHDQIEIMEPNHGVALEDVVWNGAASQVQAI
jgi:hypothetical protein